MAMAEMFPSVAISIFYIQSMDIGLAENPK